MSSFNRTFDGQYSDYTLLSGKAPYNRQSKGYSDEEARAIKASAERLRIPREIESRGYSLADFEAPRGATGMERMPHNAA